MSDHRQASNTKFRCQNLCRVAETAVRVGSERCQPARQEFSSDRCVEPWWAQRVGREALRTLSLIRWFRSTRPGARFLPARSLGASNL
jgi:hypothetical protein